MRKLALTAALVGFLAAPAMAGDHTDMHKPWGYTGAGKAMEWGDLGSDYALCKLGEKQSPVNISEYASADLPPLEIAYTATPLEVVNNGHTVQTNYAAGSTMSVGGKTYNLLQMHFHTPSEHYIDGAPYPMEVHFVHKAADGELAVVGAMMKIGAANKVVQGIWQNIPAAGETKTVESVTYSGTDLLPEGRDYYKYVGSLTTPPCSENVQWHVLKEPIEISEEQLVAFQNIYPVNARPVQPLNERTVTGK